MNEIDLTTKIEGLKKAIAEHNDFAGTYTSDLAKAEQQLKDYNKPELTASQLDDITEAIERGVEEFDFSDTDNFDIEYGIEYDGRVHCESHEMSDSSKLIEMITEEIHKLFKEVLDTTEDDNHPVEKLQN
jgi:hypothetical protein